MTETNGVNGHATNGTNGTNGNHKGMRALCESAQDFLSHEYDFVVVGGGTAGLVVAARLSEIPDVTVGVLEAGSNKLNDPMIDIPGMLTMMFHHPDYDWHFMTEPQKHNNNVRHHQVRGKALGGSSATNYMMYVRGSNQDYDDWASIVEDPSWSSQKMKQYFRKHQTLELPEGADPDTCFEHDNHGTSGPIKTSFFDTHLPIEGDFIKSCREATGLGKLPNDAWSGDHVGFYQGLISVARSGPNKGKRSYAARDYFEPVAARSNLHVLCNATVSKVELSGKKATGVSFFHAGAEHMVKTKKEVIVSCGAIQTPQVLEQ